MRKELGSLILISSILLISAMELKSAPPSSTAGFKILRSGVVSGGGTPSTIGFKVRSSLGEPIVKTMGFSNEIIFPGIQNLLSIPGAITSLSALTGDTTGTIRLQWISPGSDGTQGNIVSGKFRVAFSTEGSAIFSYSAFQVDIPTNATPGQRHGFELRNLAPGAVYFVRVFVADGATNFSYVSNGATAAARGSVFVPGSAAIDSVQVSSITVSWNANGNPANALYEMRFSTDSGFGTFTSSITASFGATAAGLVPNTSYYLKVRSFLLDGTSSAFTPVLSTTTISAIPNSPGWVGFEVFASSISVILSSNGNSAGTTVSISTGSFAISDSSSGIVATGNTVLAIYNLVSNRSYQVQARVTGFSGTPSSVTVVTSTATLPSVPGSIVFNLVTSTAISLSWSSNGNSLVPPTSYQVQVSSGDSGFSGFSSSDTFSLSMTSVSLALATTYYFRIFAFGVGGSSSAFNGSTSAFTSYPAIPAVPGSFAAGPVTENSITFTWTDNSTNEDSFQILNSTGGLYGVALANSTSIILVGLSANTLVSARIAAVNSSGSSAVSATVNRYTAANPPAGTSVLASFISSVTLAWSGNGNPASTSYEIDLSTDSGFSVFTPNFTVGTGFSILNLNPGTGYFFRTRSQNGDGLFSGFDALVSARTSSTPPSAPADLVAVSGDQKVTLEWRTNTEPDISGYNIYRSTNAAANGMKVNLALVTTSFYVDGGLGNGVSYYYRIAAVNSSSLESEFSVVLLAIPQHRSRPLPPLGLASFSNPEGNFVLSWNPVLKNEDSSDAVNISGYRIYRAPSVEEVFLLLDSVSSHSLTWVSSDPVSARYWYSVRAFNSFRDESIDSLLVKSDDNIQVAKSIDSTLQIIFTPPEIDIFNKNSNSFQEDIRIVINRDNQAETGKVLSSYDVKSYSSITNREITDLVFAKKPPTLTFRYLVLPNSNGSKAAGLNSAFPVLQSPNNVAVFKYNGVQYVNLGGKVDSVSGTIQIQTTSPLGKYQVRETIRASAFSIVETVPRKILTPNGDGVNDIFTIFFENPNSATINAAKIYNLNGGEVANLKSGSVDNSLFWDGRNENGNTVNGGLYIYQIDTGEKISNGTVVVFR